MIYAHWSPLYVCKNVFFFFCKNVTFFLYDLMCVCLQSNLFNRKLLCSQGSMCKYVKYSTFIFLNKKKINSVFECPKRRANTLDAFWWKFKQKHFTFFPCLKKNKQWIFITDWMIKLFHIIHRNCLFFLRWFFQQFELFVKRWDIAFR